MLTPGMGVGVTPCPIMTGFKVGINPGLRVGFGFGPPGLGATVEPGMGAGVGLQYGMRQHGSEGSVTSEQLAGIFGYTAHLKMKNIIFTPSFKGLYYKRSPKFTIHSSFYLLGSP